MALYGVDSGTFLWYALPSMEHLQYGSYISSATRLVKAEGQLLVYPQCKGGYNLSLSYESDDCQDECLPVAQRRVLSDGLICWPFRRNASLP
jgi:hypothetical protein